MKKQAPSRIITSVRAVHNGVVLRLFPEKKDAEDVAKLRDGGMAVEHVSQTGWFIRCNDGKWLDMFGEVKQDPNAQTDQQSSGV